MSINLDELNEKQREAVLHRGSPLMILAGAGSGKTKTLTSRAAHLIENKEAGAEEILLVTFTNKAAGEMKERVNRLVERELKNVGTFHSMAARILRKRGQEIGIAPGFVIYDTGDVEDLIKQIMAEMDLDPKRTKPRSIASAISGNKQEMLSPVDYERIARGMFQETVAQIYREYEKKLKKYQALDFDDLLGQVVKLLRNSERVRNEYQSKYKEIMVDEYQDTNAVQYTLTKLLAGDKGNLVVVGDASQSIYKWRGADYKNMLKLKNDYSNLVEIRLEQNYRSTQTILDAAHSVINNNKSHPILKLYTEAESGERIKVIEAYNASDEAERVKTEIERLLGQGYELREIAVLYRTNAQSRAMEEMLIRSGMPYVLVGGTKFYERKEIKDVLAYLRVMHNPEEMVSYRRAEKLGKRRLAKLMGERDKFMANEHTAEEYLEYVLEKTRYLDKYDEEVEEELNRVENVRELQAVASEFSSLVEFLENVALVQAEYYAGEKKGQKKDEAVTLMTLHAAKGLEYRAVFMVGMEEGLFPHSRSMEEVEELEEERRLMYVGITRAKKRLYLSYAHKRMVWGKTGVQMKSRFIEEIEPELLSQPLSKKIKPVNNPASNWNNAWKSQDGWGSKKQTNWERKKPKVIIDELSDDTLENFLSGNISVEELLN